MALRGTLDLMPASLAGWRSIVQADLAAALAGQSEVEEACGALMAALALAAEAGTARCAERARGVRRRLLPPSGSPALAHLDERLAAAG